MVAPTASSSEIERPSARATGWFSLFFGLLAVAVLPVTVLVSYETDRYSYLESGFAVPGAALLAIVAIVLGRRGRKRQRQALGRVRGARVARLGRLLGWLGFYLAATGALALGVYALETYLSG